MRSAGSGAGHSTEQAGTGRSVSTPAGRPRPTTPGGGRSRPRRWRRAGDQRIRSASTRCGASAAVGFDEDGRAADYEQVVSPEEWISELLRKDLTVGSTTFTDTAVTEAVARRLGRGATVTTIEITALVIADPQVLAVATDDGRRWFTSRLHDIEERFVDVVTRRDTTARSIPRCGGAHGAADVGRRPGHSGVPARRVVRAVERADRPGRHRQDLHPRHRPRRLRTSRWRVIGAGPSARPPRSSPPAPASRPAPCTPCSATSSAASNRSTPTPCSSSTKPAWPTSAPSKPSSTSRRTGQPHAARRRSTPDAASRRRRRLRTPPPTPAPSPSSPSTAASEPSGNSRRSPRCATERPHAVGAYLEHGRVVVTADASSMISDAIGRWAAALDVSDR